MHAYVTGATGCVGGNLVRELIAQGWHVTAALRRGSDVSRLGGLFGLRVVRVDLYSPGATADSIPASTDVVFHCAANISHWRRDRAVQFADNVTVTRNIVQACLARGVGRLVFTSTAASSAAHGNRASALTIRNNYVRTKRLAELDVCDGMQRGLDAVIIQPACVIGAHDRNGYSHIFRAIADGRMPFAFPGTIFFGHAAAVARAHVAAATAPSGFYMLGGVQATWLEFANTIARVIGRPPITRVASIGQLRVMAAAMGVAALFTRSRPPITFELVGLLAGTLDVPPAEAELSARVLGYDSKISLEAMVRECWWWMKGG